MGKVRTSLSLSKFDVISGTKEKVIEDLTEMIHQIQDAESSFVSSPGYQDLTENIISGQVKVTQFIYSRLAFTLPFIYTELISRTE